MKCDEAGIKTPTSPHIFCCATLQKVCVELFIYISEDNMLDVMRVCSIKNFYLLIYLFLGAYRTVVNTQAVASP